MSERFFHPGPISLGPLELEGPDAHHLATVCRARVGDELTLFNGDGREYPGRILALGKRSATIEVLNALAPSRELPFFLEIAASLPKGDRGIFLIEKLTEVGVSRFVPLECRRTIVHAREGKLDKLQRHVVEACKQCERNVLMEIAEPTAWSRYLVPSEADTFHGIVHPKIRGDGPDDFATPSVRSQTVRLALGPEGGFAPEELALAQEHGWQFVDLGPRILRVETAALVTATWAIFHQGERPG